MRFSTPLLAVAVLAACADSTTTPSNALIGQWGGQGVELSIDAQNVILAAPCNSHFTGRGPIIPYQGSRFIVSLTRDSDGQVGQNNQSTSAHAVSGVTNGDQLTIQFTSITIGGNFLQSYTLMRNAPKGIETGCDI
jgi:hypothetical protein